MNESEEKLSLKLQDLNSISKEKVSELVAIILFFLIDPLHYDIQINISEFAQSNESLKVSSLKNIVQALLIIFQEAMKCSDSMVNIQSKLQRIGLNNEIIAVILNEWSSNMRKIMSSLLSKTITNNKLVDMDWSFGVSVSSDDCNTIGKTFIQIKLVIEENNTNKDIFMELSIEQFYQFFASLEKCQSYMEFVNPN